MLKSEKTAVYLSWLLFLGLIAVKLWWIAHSMVIDDESYYYAYSKHLAAGYIDHGPVIAYFIRFGTLLFGPNPFGIRFTSVLSLSVLSVAIYFFLKSYFSTRCALVGFTTINLMTLFIAGSLITTPDTPMLFFFTIATMLYYLGYEKDRRFLYMGGFFLGLGMLSKISVLFSSIAIFIYPFLDKNKRHILKTREFWISFVISLIVFSPFVIWNFNNDFAFVRYQGSHVFRKGDLGDFFDLWGAQIGLSFPVFFFIGMGYGLRSIYNRVTRRESDSGALFYFSLLSIIPFLYFFPQSFFSKYEANWPAPIFIGLCFIFPIVVDLFWDRLHQLFYAQIGFTFVITGLLFLHLYHPFLPIDPKHDISNRYHLYQAFEGELKSAWAGHPEWHRYRVVGNNYQIPSMFNLYLKPEMEAVCLSIDGYHKTLYSFYYPDARLEGKDFIFILPGNTFAARFNLHAFYVFA